MKLKSLASSLAMGFRKHEGTILTITNIVSTCAAVYSAFKAAPKVMAKLEELKESDLTTLEKVKEIAPIIGPTVIFTGVSVTSAAVNCKWASDSINTLSSIISLKNAAEEERKKATKEVIGEEQENAINDKVVENRGGKVGQVISYGEGPTRRYVHTGKGNDLFHEPITDNWFYSNQHAVKNAVGEVNDTLRYADVCVDEYAYLLNVPPKTYNEDEYFFANHGKVYMTLEAAKDEDDQLYYEMVYAGNKPVKWDGKESSR
jgi:hypothetical protein